MVGSKPQGEAARNLEQQKLEKKIKSAERAVNNVVPTSFSELLAAALEKINSHGTDPVTGGFVGPVRTAKFEADALIKGRFLNSKSILNFLTDADISTDLGYMCVVVNVFT